MTVVLGYDDSPSARAALGVAVDVAKGFGEPLTVVYGARPPGGAGEEFRAHEAALEETGRRTTAAAMAAAEAAGVPAELEVVPLSPVEALLRVADVRKARMVVVGTYAESPLRGAILGSTPHKLLHLSARPVLCVPAAAES